MDASDSDDELEVPPKVVQKLTVKLSNVREVDEEDEQSDAEEEEEQVVVASDVAELPLRRSKRKLGKKVMNQSAIDRINDHFHREDAIIQ